MTADDPADRHSPGVGYLHIKPDVVDSRDTVLTIHDSITRQPWAHIVYSPDDLRRIVKILRARLDYLDSR